MITEQQLDDMARDKYPGTSSLDHTMRETWKKAYKWKEKHNPPKPAYVGNPSLPAERIQNGLQYQEEMLKLGFEKVRVIVAAQPNWLPLPKVEVNTDAAREHFQHVHALIANTATQQAYRQELEFIGKVKELLSQTDEESDFIYSLIDVTNGKEEHLTRCLAELEAQFADLEQKIFGTVPAEHETPDRVELLQHQAGIVSQMEEISRFLAMNEIEDAPEDVLKQCFDKRVRYGQLKEELSEIAARNIPRNR